VGLGEDLGEVGPQMDPGVGIFSALGGPGVEDRIEVESCRESDANCLSWSG
jgi:hypothetical protein